MTDVTLDDLISLNQEIAAFVKAGIPLELGLKGLSGSVHSRTGTSVATGWPTRMARRTKVVRRTRRRGIDRFTGLHGRRRSGALASGKLPEALQSLHGFHQVVPGDSSAECLSALLYPAASFSSSRMRCSVCL